MINPTATILYSYLRTGWLARRFRTRDALLAWQDRQVQQFLKRILPRSPFYRRRFAGLDLKRWRTLPVIEKSVMMANFDELNTVSIGKDEAFLVAHQAEESRNFAPTLRGVTVGLSSGTSGNRGLFLASDLERYQWAGAALAKVLPGPLWEGQRVAFFLRANSNLYTAVDSQRIRFSFYDLLEPIAEHIHRLNHDQPTILVAPPSLLRRIATRALHITPRKVVSVAEVLDPLDQTHLQRYFGQPIHQVYQATEGFLASTCRHGVLHLHEEMVAVQKEWIDKTQRKFAPIITDFMRSSQPIIRYRLDDILTERATPCPCGAITTALDCIEGRCDDLFYLPARNSGGWVTVFPDFLSRAVITAAPEVEEYSVRQRQLDLIEIALQTSQRQADAEINVRHALQRLFARLGCQAPHLRFCKYEASFTTPGHERSGSVLRKHKRVERLFDLSEPAPATSDPIEAP
jgi:putative adenylate-forming enzyme